METLTKEEAIEHVKVLKGVRNYLNGIIEQLGAKLAGVPDLCDHEGAQEVTTMGQDRNNTTRKFFCYDCGETFTKEYEHV